MEATVKNDKETIAKIYEEKMGVIVKQLEKQNNDLSVKIKAMEEDAIKARKAPILDKLKGYGLSAVTLKHMESWEEKDLMEELKNQETRAPKPPIVRSSGESRILAMEGNDANINKMFNEARDAFRKELGLK
jgi:hypothetical protein